MKGILFPFLGLLLEAEISVNFDKSSFVIGRLGSRRLLVMVGRRDEIMAKVDEISHGWMRKILFYFIFSFFVVLGNNQDKQGAIFNGPLHHL